jgi:hypothetical protein
MRHRLEERVLHLIESTQAPRGLALDLECTGELLFRLFALRDVDQEALPERRAPLELYEQRRVFHPDDAAVLADHPVLEAEATVAVAVALDVGGEHAVSVVGMDRAGPQGRVGQDLLGGVAEHVGLLR